MSTTHPAPLPAAATGASRGEGTTRAPGAPWPAESITLTVLGPQATQGSKKPAGFRTSKTGKLIAHFVEDDEDLAAWREKVANAATVAKASLPYRRRPLFPLDGPIAVEMVFTLRERPAAKPGWWPKTVPWSGRLMWRPATKPDLSKLMRAVEDSLSKILWQDDARVVQYDRLAKYYVGDSAPDVLEQAGVVIRIRQIGGER